MLLLGDCLHLPRATTVVFKSLGVIWRDLVLYRVEHLAERSQLLRAKHDVVAAFSLSHCPTAEARRAYGKRQYTAD